VTARHRWAGALVLWNALIRADFHDAEAQAKVEALPRGAITVGERLAEEARIHSRRDLGWRFFPGDYVMEVERSFRVSKSMEMRFRRRVDSGGKAEALTEPAQQLCR
jgi:hypothetical protein